jgi:hypothetical protein
MKVKTLHENLARSYLSCNHRLDWIFLLVFSYEDQLEYLESSRSNESILTRCWIFENHLSQQQLRIEYYCEVNILLRIHRFGSTHKRILWNKNGRNSLNNIHSLKNILISWSSTDTEKRDSNSKTRSDKRVLVVYSALQIFSDVYHIKLHTKLCEIYK